MIILNQQELCAVAGGSSAPAIERLKLKVLEAQDMEGITMSHEDWMNFTRREFDPARGDSIHDFPGGVGR